MGKTRGGLYSQHDQERQLHEKEREDYRSPYRRDYARLIHSPAFRRLQGKTQLFPGIESDFFRNRLTHSLEVAQVAKSIANKINHEIEPFNSSGADKVDTDLVEFAGLAHDLGHPPFGHNGEMALDEMMLPFGGFEGNAQTLRQLAVLEKKVRTKDEKSERYGLNLCFRSLAAVLKYDKAIPAERTTVGVKKGYYQSEERLVRNIKDKVVGNPAHTDFKTIECYIMDVADDIAYGTYDLEDSLKAGFLSLLDFINLPNDPQFDEIAKKVWKRVYQREGSDSELGDFKFQLWNNLIELVEFLLPSSDSGDKPIESSSKGFSNRSKKDELPYIYQDAMISATVYEQAKLYQRDGYFRTEFTSSLVGRFINSIEVSIDTEHLCLSKVEIKKETLALIETLKIFTYEKHILSPRLKVTEYRGKDFIRSIFTALMEDDGYMLLPEDWKREFVNRKENEKEKARVVCDFIAGMTDRYALEFYGRLFSENPQTIFKDL